VPYHYHNDRESVIIAISGRATEVIEGKEFPVKAVKSYLFLRGETYHDQQVQQDFRYLNSSPIRRSAPISWK